MNQREICIFKLRFSADTGDRADAGMHDEDFQRRSNAASRGGEREDRRSLDPGH